MSTGDIPRVNGIKLSVGFYSGVLGFIYAGSIFLSTTIGFKWFPNSSDDFAKYLAITALFSGFALLALDHYLFRVTPRDSGKVVVLPRRAINMAITSASVSLIASSLVSIFWIAKWPWVLATTTTVAAQAALLWGALLHRVRHHLVRSTLLSGAWRITLFAAIGIAGAQGGEGLTNSLPNSISLMMLFMLVVSAFVIKGEQFVESGSGVSSTPWIGFFLGAVGFSSLAVVDRALVDSLGVANLLTLYTLLATFVLLPANFASTVLSGFLSIAIRQGRSEDRLVRLLADSPAVVTGIVALGISLVGLVSFFLFYPAAASQFTRADYALTIALSASRGIQVGQGARYSVNALVERLLPANFVFVLILLIGFVLLSNVASVRSVLVGVLVITWMRIAIVRQTLRVAPDHDH